MGLFFEFAVDVISLCERPSGDFAVRFDLWEMEGWPWCFAPAFTRVIFEVFPIGTIFAVFGHARTLPLICCIRLETWVQIPKRIPNEPDHVRRD